MGLGYVLIGTLVFLMKSHRRSSWIFFLSTSTFGLWQFFIYKISLMTPLWLEGVVIFAYTFTPAVIIHLALCFPKERFILIKIPYVQFFPYFIATFLFIGIRLSTSQDIMDAPKFWLILAVAYIALGILFFLGSCVQLRLRSSSEIVKLRSNMILLGFAITASIPLVDYVINTIFNVFILPGFNYYLPFFIFFPAFVGYSIVKHDLFDIDAIIKRTYGYILTTGTIAGIYGIFVLLSNLAFGGYEFSKSPAFPLIFILAIVFLFNPIRDRVQKIIDRVFYRLEYNYQETVQQIGETLRSLLKLEHIGERIMNFALQPMFVDSGAVMILNRQETAYDCLIHSGVPEEKKDNRNASEVGKENAEQPPSEVECLTLAADEPFIRKMAQKKKTTTVYDIQEDRFFEADRSRCLKTFDQLGATLVVPLIYEDQLIGMISLGRKKSGKFYRREDINLLNTLANQAAVAIENARMVEEVVEKERMEEELNIARDLQVSMLPSAYPQIKGFEIAAYSVSAREVGGDFYDFIDMGDEKAGMIIGDVTGKSVSGALVMSASRSVFRMLSEEVLNVNESMMRANRRLKKDVKTGMFVALLFAVVNSQDRTMTLCSAGQTQPVLFSAKTAEVSLVETQGDTFPLGILEDAAYEETRLHLEIGDKVILYTDGVVETMDEQKEIFGFDRLLKVVKNSQAKMAESLLEEIKKNVNEFAGSALQHDDITIIVIQATE
jgi:serine phosphatase RsbU (regulator of sigma subunit)